MAWSIDRRFAGREVEGRSSGLGHHRVAIEFLRLTLNPRTADAAGLVGIAHPRSR
jgi:hypothetical protein